MNIGYEKWTNMGILEEIQKLKPITFESSESELLAKDLEEYRSQSLTPEGACLFCYCRGRITEGLNLSDGHCRGLFLIGFPYPNIKDQILLRKEKLLGEQSIKSTKDLIAMQTVNQTIGRLIRHIADYGAVFLCE